MPREIKAFQFWVKPNDGGTEAVRDAVAVLNDPDRTFEFAQHGKEYLADELHWSQQQGVLTGTVYLLRSSNLPAAVRDGHVEPLPIEDETDLGEPMCFAFHAEVGVALIQYSHTGPRHPVLAPIVNHFLSEIPIVVEPVIKTDMLEQLRRKRYFRGLEFTLTDPRGIQDLRAAGGSVNRAISMLEDLGGVNIHVQVSMGHTQGEGLARDATRNLAELLTRVATEQVDHEGHNSGVGTIKVKGADGQDAPIQELDMLRARERITLEVREQNRSIDTRDARGRLKRELMQRLDDLRLQAGLE